LCFNKLMSEKLNEPNFLTNHMPQLLQSRLAQLTCGGLLVVGLIANQLHEDGLADQVDAANTSLQVQSDTNAKTAQQLNTLEGLVAGLANVDVGTITGATLSSVTDLPNYGQPVSEQTAAEMRQSLVLLVQRKPTSVPGQAPNAWTDECSALKVPFAGQDYVMTAGHCLSSIRPIRVSETGSTNPEDFPNAYNMTFNQSEDYGVQTINPDGSRSEVTPVDAISQSAVRDTALLRIDGSNDSRSSFGSQPSFSGFESALAKNHIDARAGQQVAFYSMPGSAVPSVLEGHGTYLGNTLIDGDKGGIVDLVGIENVDNGTKNPCNYGASGSMGILASGDILGPLSTVNTTAYRNETAHTNDPSEAIPNNAAYIRIDKEQKLKLDLSRYDVVCGFSSINTTALTELVEGFTHPATPAVLGNGTK
jgi:hypothetical protein